MTRVATLAMTCLLLTAIAAGAGQGGRGAAPPISRDPSMGPAPAAAGTGAISGTLIAADTGRPIRRARMSVVASGAGFSKSAVTDDQGRFTFTGLPAAEFNLTASRPGFLDVTYGQRQPGSGRPGTPLKLETGQKLDRVTLRIPRGGVITGTIIDESGEPTFGANVRAMRYVMRNGERTLQQAGNGTTDDRGIYRIPALLPGEYVVNVTPRDSSANMVAAEISARMDEVKASIMSANEAARADLTAMAARLNSITPTAEEPTGYATVYHPSTTQLGSAATLTLGISEERPNVDIQLQLVPMAKIAGGVLGPDGAPMAGTSIQLLDISSPVPGIGSRSARVMPDGQFSFTQVPPGRYMLVARASQRGRVEVPINVPQVEAKEIKLEAKLANAMMNDQANTSLWAMMETSVDGRDLAGIVLPLQKGMTVSGSFAFDGAPPPGFDPTRVRVTMTPLSQNMLENLSVPAGSGDSTGKFALRGVMPGRYRLNVTAGGGLMPRSAMFGAVDVFDAMVEIKPGEDLANGIVTFATKLGELGGSMRDAANGPITDFTIVLFSAEPRFWTPQSRRIQAVRPSSDGSFSFRNLPAGDYRVVAVIDPEPGQWFDAKYLEALLGGSIIVKVNEGQKTTQDLRAGR